MPISDGESRSTRCGSVIACPANPSASAYQHGQGQPARQARALLPQGPDIRGQLRRFDDAHGAVLQESQIGRAAACLVPAQGMQAMRSNGAAALCSGQGFMGAAVSMACAKTISRAELAFIPLLCCSHHPAAKTIAASAYHRGTAACSDAIAGACLHPPIAQPVI